MYQKKSFRSFLVFVARQGLEPRSQVPETCVLPLDDLAICLFFSIYIYLVIFLFIINRGLRLGLVMPFTLLLHCIRKLHNCEYLL